MIYLEKFKVFRMNLTLLILFTLLIVVIQKNPKNGNIYLMVKLLMDGMYIMLNQLEVNGQLIMVS